MWEALESTFPLDGVSLDNLSDDYQRETLDQDNAYTSKNPLEAGNDDGRDSDNE